MLLPPVYRLAVLPVALPIVDLVKFLASALNERFAEGRFNTSECAFRAYITRLRLPLFSHARKLAPHGFAYVIVEHRQIAVSRVESCRHKSRVHIRKDELDALIKGAP